MSHPHPATAAAAAASASAASASAAVPSHGPSHKRPRAAADPPPVDRDEKKSQHCPAWRLAPHSLECVFEYMSFGELSRVMSVHRSWTAAVLSMRPRNALLQCSPPPVVLCCSPLACCHIGGLSFFFEVDGCQVQLDCRDLMLLASCMRRLQSLSFAVTPQPTALVFAPTLTDINVQFVDTQQYAWAAAKVNAAIWTLSALPALESLVLDLPERLAVEGVSFAPLQSTARLRSLTFFLPVCMDHLTDAQVSELRGLPALSTMHCLELSNESLRRLLRRPHTLQWSNIGEVTNVGDSTSDALESLPSLTELIVRYPRTLRFLRCMHHLRQLELDVDPEDWGPTGPDIVAALSACTSLESLALSAPVRCEHMLAMLFRLTRLESLTLDECSHLESLSFLSNCPTLHLSLRDLSLIRCRHPALHTAQLIHVYSLRSLESLTIDESFAEPMDQVAWTLHRRRSAAALLALVEFNYNPPPIANPRAQRPNESDGEGDLPPWVRSMLNRRSDADGAGAESDAALDDGDSDDYADNYPALIEMFGSDDE